MKRSIALLLCLVFTQVASANPFSKVYRFVDTHKRFFIMEGAAVTAAAIHAKGLQHCRRGDVEQCDTGYGEAWAWYGVATSWSVVIGPSLAEKCWRDNDDWKGCYFFGYSGPAYQLSQGIYDFRNYKPEEKHDKDHCHDLRCEDRRFR